MALLYVVLPRSSGWSDDGGRLYRSALSSFHRAARGVAGVLPPEVPTGLKVLDSIRALGPKLVTLSDTDALRLRASRPDLQLVRCSQFRLALAEVPAVRKPPKLAENAVSLNMRIRVESASGGAPVPGVRVVAFTNFAERTGKRK